MKQNPEMLQAQRNMQPGVLTMHGFLGDDRRDLVQIIDEDASRLRELNLSPEKMADKMEYFREQGKKGLGEFIKVEPHFAVKVDSVRGKLPCPFGGPGMMPKTNITVKNLKEGVEITFTDMNIHCIRGHGFFEGMGSFFRTDPETLARVLEISPGEDSGY